MEIKFDSYGYYPALRTRPAEMEGFGELANSTKDKLLPVVTLGAWPRMDGLSESLARLQRAVDDRPVILDLTKELSYQNQEVRHLLASDGNFSSWCRYAAGIPNAVPVVQIVAGAKQSQIIRQTKQLADQGTRKVAFRITNFNEDTQKVINSLSAMDDAENALVIIDAGYIRETMAASISACAVTINDIRDEIPEAIITVLSTSYPAAVTPFIASSSNGTSGVIDILERELHLAVGSSSVIYGDHSSIHAKVYPSTGGKYTPQIDLSLYDAWVIERRPNADGLGYIEVAQALLSKYPDISTDSSWGAEMIRQAANGQIEKKKARAKWIAVRVNTHIEKQCELSAQVDSDDEDIV
jgi:hypothetical protein